MFLFIITYFKFIKTNNRYIIFNIY